MIYVKEVKLHHQNSILDKKVGLRDSTVMESGGGTALWCFSCDAIRECKVLWYYNDSKGNFVHPEFSDLHWRERPRECNKCGHIFHTYEVDSKVMDELVALRKLMLGIKVNTEKQQKSITEIIKKYRPIKRKG